MILLEPFFGSMVFYSVEFIIMLVVDDVKNTIIGMFECNGSS